MPQSYAILELFSQTMENLALDESSIQELLQIHQDLKPMTLHNFLAHLNTLASRLRVFVLRLEAFQSLSMNDQEVLLKNNIPLYLQYITGRYLTSNSGLEQLTWILEGNLPLISPDDVFNLTSVSFEQFVCDQHLNHSSEVFEMYSDYLAMLKHFFTFPYYFNGLIANMLLYYMTESVKNELEDPEKVEMLFSEAKELVEKQLDKTDLGENVFQLSAFPFVLSQMMVLFGYMKASNTLYPPALRVFGHHISLNQTEENWLIHKFERMQLQFKTVAPTGKMTHDLLNVYMKKQEISPENSVQWTQMTKERVKRMLIDQAEFQDLSRTEQHMLIGKNIGSATILAILQANSARTGKAQLKNFVGYLDPKDRSWEARFCNVMDLDKLGLIHIHKSSPLGRKLSDSQTSFIAELLKDVSELFSDQYFLFLMLLTFSDTEDLPSTPALKGISNLHKLYLRFLQQKLVLANSSLSDPQLLCTTLNKLKILTKLFQTYVIEGFLT